MSASPTEPHPFADIFPMIGAKELKELAADIKKNALNFPIMTYEGKILDGRNRLKACGIVGVRPYFVEFQGTREAALAYVWSQNGTRRHLTTSQRAMSAAAIAKQAKEIAKKAEEPPITQKDAAKTLGVSRRSAQYATEVLEDGTEEEIEAVKSGKEKVTPTAEKIRKRKKLETKQTTKDEELKDDAGVEIPTRLRDLFGDPWLKELINNADKWIMQIGAKAIPNNLKSKSKPYAAFLKAGDAMHSLAAAVDALAVFRELLAAGLPHCVCPSCHGKKCDKCRNAGWVPEWKLNEMSK